MEQNKYNVKVDLNGKDYEVPRELRYAILNMMKFMVSNEWNQNISKEEVNLWLSSGTHLSVNTIEIIANGEDLYNEKFIAGMKDNPFKDVVEERRIAKSKSRER